MDEGRHPGRRERGTTTLESIGLAVVVALLLGAVSTSLHAGGRPIGERVAGRVQQLVQGEALQLPGGSRRTTRERRWSGGDDPVRVGRDELRMSPVLGPLALWTERWRWQGRPAGIDTRGDVRACAGCADLQWSHGLRTGAGIDARGSDVGFEATIRAAARVALASVDASVRASRPVGPATLQAQLRGRATVGADAEGEAKLRLSQRAQELQLHGSAAAGAVARAETRFGVDVLGIAIRQGARGEAWAGAGASGTVGVRREAERVTWRLGWGAALGLGGAAEFSGSIDVSGVEERHRRITRASLAAIVGIGPRLLVNAYHP